MDVRGIRTRVKRCIVVEYEDEEIRNRRRFVRVGGRRGLEGNRKRGTYRSEGSPMEVGRAAVGRGLWMDGEHQSTRYELSTTTHDRRHTSYPSLWSHFNMEPTHPQFLNDVIVLSLSLSIIHMPYAERGTENVESSLPCNRHSSFVIVYSHARDTRVIVNS